MTDLTWMAAPIVACLLAMGALGWFGLHVLQRGVIFVDLALAQIAALGATYAVFLGHQPDEPVGLALSLSFTCFGAVGFAGLRQFEDRVPQEALIGIAYAVSAALGVLMIELADDPHGAEKIQHLLVGNIVWVRWHEIAVAAVAIAVVGVANAVLGRRLLLISFEPARARAEGMHVALWDLVFYLGFGVVLTTIVNIVGVLLVFSFLVIPAVIARLYVNTISQRLAVAYAVGVAASVAGVSVSYEHSTGPIVVGLLGAALAVALLVLSVRRAASPGLRLVQVLGVAAVLAGVLWAFAQVGGHEGEAQEGHADHADEVEPIGAATPNGPADATAPFGDPLSELEAATGRARAGEIEGLQGLVSLVETAPPFVRMEADAVLRQALGEAAPTYDPIGAPDVQGQWRATMDRLPADWAARLAGTP